MSNEHRDHPDYANEFNVRDAEARHQKFRAGRTDAELRRDLEENARKTVRVVSCGCCTNGCVCFMHRDEPRGIFKNICQLHQHG